MIWYDMIHIIFTHILRVARVSIWLWLVSLTCSQQKFFITLRQPTGRADLFHWSPPTHPLYKTDIPSWGQHSKKVVNLFRLQIALQPFTGASLNTRPSLLSSLRPSCLHTQPWVRCCNFQAEYWMIKSEVRSSQLMHRNPIWDNPEKGAHDDS